MTKKSIICILLALLLLCSAVPALGEGEPAEEPKKVPGERVNFLVAGVDHIADGGTTSGTMVHADTVIVVSVDFENDMVDIISLPRDMFVRVPGHKGYYKLNAAFNVGGGMDDPNGGFLALCDTAGEILGGISIPYYIAVDISSLEGLIDAVGGVDIELDQSFTIDDCRHYEAGFQHLNGVGFVDYVRVRKSATVEHNDIGRTSRQRRALIALYKTVKQKGIISTLPALFNSFKEGVWTNISLNQMVTLANYAMGFDPDSVGMHNLPGTIRINHGWAYHFIDQQARKELILEVFGFEPEVYGIDSINYADYLHNSGFRCRKTIAQAEKVFTALAAQIESGKPMTPEQEQLYSDAYVAYTEAVEAADALDAFMMLYPDGVPREKRDELKKLKDRVSTTQKNCKKTTVALGKTLGFTDKDYQWAVWPTFYRDLDINEMIVDFN